MRFLADESCDFAVVRALRNAGHDVTAISEMRPGLPDDAVIAIAETERRIVLTEDRDFGQLVYAAGAASHGVILLRFPTQARAGLPGTVLRLVEERHDDVAHRFIVVEPGRIRIGGARPIG